MSDTYVCSGATMRCTMGTSPSTLTVLPTRTVYLKGKPQANISDHTTIVNLAPFGLCRSMGFPQTAAATAAALGVLTPTPCMHNTPKPWSGGKDDVLVKGQPALLSSSTCQCMWGGTISLVTNGQKSQETPPDEMAFVNPLEKPKKVDEIILWDAYWEKDLEKDLGQTCQYYPTKLRFIPQQIEATLSLVFYFKHEHNKKYDQDNATFTLRFEIPGTCYEPKEYEITGANIKKFEKVSKEGHNYYICSIEGFSSDLTKADFSKLGFVEKP